ncbi:MAG: hypothetical protein WCW33_04135 [Candidatus Babeliales bacterium]|jgi:hypothetical protein
MEKWTADFINNPDDAYKLIVEILYNGHDVAIIKKEDNALKIIWYANPNDLDVPFEWLLGLMNEAKKVLSAN